MANPKISVIIPIYGTEKYLEKCLRSVREQTFKDIEIICVDDCSPDNSYKIVEKHRKKDKRIVFIRHKENLGLGGARNTAIRAAKAEFIASVDSDDYMSPKMLETLWDATDNGWFDIVCCGYNRVDSNGNILSKVEYEDQQVSNDEHSIDIFTLLNPAFWNKLWRKSLFVDNDIFFPEHDYYEDMSTTPRILAKSKYVKVIKKCLYRYLIRDQSIMNGMSDKHIIDYLKGFEITYGFLEDNGLTERYRKEFFHYIRGNFLFYSKSILNSGLLIDKKSQYLRLLVLFRITFTENFNKFNRFDINGLLSSLNEEDLHGLYFDKYQQSVQQVEKKENIITTHWSEIETKASKIVGLNKTVRSLRNGLDKAESDLSKQNKRLKETKISLRDTEYLLGKTQSDLENSQGALSNSQVDLQSTKEVLSNTQSELNKSQKALSSTLSELKSSQKTLSSTQNELENSQKALSNTQSELKKSQQNLNDTKSDLKETKIILNETQTNLKKTNELFSSTKIELKERIGMLNSTQADLSETKKDLNNVQSELKISEEKRDSLNTNLDATVDKLERTKETLTIKEGRVTILEEEVAERVSFAQMIAVFLFAILTYFVMNSKQTMKLINKPKMFFRDSKSGFARRYASLFNII